MTRVELTPEENLLLLQEIEANRAFILLAYQSDPALLKLADPQRWRICATWAAAAGSLSFT